MANKRKRKKRALESWQMQAAMAPVLMNEATGMMPTIVPLPAAFDGLTDEGAQDEHGQ